VSLIREVENMNVITSYDGYVVTMSLKDNTTYVYSPRRFAWTERNQIRQRSKMIFYKEGSHKIKHLILLCESRTIVVIKKNDFMRLC